MGDRESIFFMGEQIETHFELLELGCCRFDPPHRGYALVVIAERAPAPPPEMRARAGEVFERIAAQTHAMAVVVEGGGIVATTKRTMARVMVGLSRSRLPFRVYKSIDEALAWLRQEAASRDHEVFAAGELPARLGAA